MLTKLCKLGVIAQISMFTFWSTFKIFRAFNKKNEPNYTILLLYVSRPKALRSKRQSNNLPRF